MGADEPEGDQIAEGCQDIVEFPGPDFPGRRRENLGCAEVERRLKMAVLDETEVARGNVFRRGRPAGERKTENEDKGQEENR
jgi:hypothetical protein